MRQRSQAVDAAFALYERDRRSVGNVLAGAVAFRLFVYLLPLALVVVSLLGVVSSLNESGPEDAAQEVGLGQYLVDSVATAASQSRRGLWILIPLSLFALYSGGTAAMKVLRAVHSLAWGMPVVKPRRGFAAAAGLFAVAFGLVAVILLLKWIRHVSPLLGLWSMLAAMLVFGGAWLLASARLPHGDASLRDLVPGAVLMALGAEGLHLVSVYWLTRRIQSASELYGGLGAAAAILTWLYLLGRLMVASAMLNATLWERQRRRAS